MQHPYDLACEAILDHGAIQKSQELAGLLALVMDIAPQLIVEIGSFDGGTLWAWTQICPHVIGVDMPPAGHETTVRVNKIGVPVLCGDSHDPATAAELIRMLNGHQIDMLFIDGDHTYEGVKADFELYSPLVRPGGLVCFHDICGHPNMEFVEVNRFWASLEGDTEVFVSSPRTWGGIGVIRIPTDPDAEQARRQVRHARYLRDQEASYGTSTFGRVSA